MGKKLRRRLIRVRFLRALAGKRPTRRPFFTRIRKATSPCEGKLIRAGPVAVARPASWLGQPVVKTVCALSAVLFTFFTLAWLVEKRGPQSAATSPTKTIELLQRVSINPRQYLQLMRLGDRVLLLAVGPTGCRTLSEITDPVEVHRLSGRPSESLSALPEVMRSMLQDNSSTGAGAVFQRQA